MQSKITDIDPLCWLEFTEDSIITSCKSGKLLRSDGTNFSVSNNVCRPHPNMGPTRDAVMEVKYLPELILSRSRRQDTQTNQVALVLTG